MLLVPKLECTPYRFWDSLIWNIDKSLPIRTDSGIPVPIWGPHFECRSNLQFGDETLKSQIGMNPIPLLVSD
jgi:hypothetical protein